VNATARACDTAFRQKRIERNEQIQIEMAQLQAFGHTGPPLGVDYRP
jgi:hypothetical protein